MSLLLLAACTTEPGPAEGDTGDADGDGIPNATDRCDGVVLGANIVVAADADTDLSAAVTDAASLLQRTSGVSFTVVSTLDAGCAAEATAVFVKLASEIDASAPAEVQAGAATLIDPQAYRIDQFRGRGAWIVATTPRGLVHGIYGFLEQNGVRFWLPGDLWTAVHPHGDLRADIHRTDTPKLRTFAFGGQGGRGGSPQDLGSDFLGFDGKHDVDTIAWFKRNRPPFGYSIGGHQGEAYNQGLPHHVLENPDETACVPCESTDEACLARLPDALCHDRDGVVFRRSIDGREGVNFLTKGDGQTIKVDATDHGTADLADFTTDSGVAQSWSDFVLSFADAQIANLGAGEELVLSAEPADGTNYCQCDKCVAMLRNGADFFGVDSDADASVSDQVFHLANHAARKAASNPVAYPGALVNIFAYAEHAEVPTIPIEPNMLVLVAAYAFQAEFTGLTPDELIAAWGEKKASDQFRMGIYDYWNSPDFSFDEPTTSPDFASAQIQYFVDVGFETVVLESTFGMGGIGLPLWVAHHAAWTSTDGNAALTDPNAALDAFCDDEFGAGAAGMRELLHIFWDEPWVGSQAQVSAALAAMQVVYAATADADTDTKERVAAFGSYVEYLKRRAQILLLLGAPDANEKVKDAVEGELEWLLRTARYGFTHTDRMWSLLLSNFGSRIDAEAWDHVHSDGGDPPTLIPNGPAAAAALSAQLTPEDVEIQIGVSATENPPLRLVPPMSTTAPLVPFQPDAAAGELVTTWFDWHGGDFAVYADAGQNVSLTILSVTARSDMPPLNVEVRAPDGSVVFRRRFESRIDPDFGAPTRTVVAWTAGVTGVYNLNVLTLDSDTYVAFELPSDLPFARKLPFLTSVGVPFDDYVFFVPRGTTRFAFESDCSLPTFAILRPNGVPADVTRFGPAFVVDVPAGEDAQRWTLDGPCLNLRFDNIPNVVSYDERQLLVPNDGL